MKTLDRYVLRGFVFTLTFALLSFVAIFVIVDVIEHLDKFIDSKATILEVVRYYVAFLPYIIVLTIPVAMLLASLFSVGNLARRNELTAMKASGLSLYRIIAPLLAFGLFVSLAVSVFGEYVVPSANAEMQRVYDEDIRGRTPRAGEVRRNVQRRGRDGRLYSIRTFDSGANRGNDVVVVSVAANRVTERVDVDVMEWTGDVWRLTGTVVRRFPTDTTVYYRQVTDTTIADWSLRPDDLLHRQKKPEAMSFGELSAYIDRVEAGGDIAHRELVDLYLKISFPLSNFIIVLFGAPLAANPRRSGAAVGFGISIAIAFVYFSLIKASQAFGYAGKIDPILAAWSGNLLFGAAGVVILLRVRK
jgi:lipopolysaccharide export system permease protein